MQLVSVKDKKASFAMVLMAVDSQLRMRDLEGFCDKLSSTHPLLKKKTV